MNEQAPNQGKRGFLKNLLGLGAVAAIGTTAMVAMTGPEDIEKETTGESVGKLLNEMKYIERVSVVRTTANENSLSENGWIRLDKIINEKFSDRKGNPDAFITKKELELFKN